jgi:hypothetical protein
VFVLFSNKQDTDSITFEEAQETLARIRGKLAIYVDYIGENGKKSTYYTSYQKYYDDTFKHKRKPANPSETFKLPVSTGHNWGFNKFLERDLNYQKYPKVKCDETKYAESIIMSRQTFTK